MARRLTDSFGKAVMKIVGIRNPRLAKSACNSTPLIFGICTSEIKHAVSASRCDWRNSCADANVCTSKPSDFTRFSVAARTAASSSTIVPMRGVPSVLTGSENMDTAPQCWGLNPILDGMHYTQGDEGLVLRSPLKKSRVKPVCESSRHLDLAAVKVELSPLFGSRLDDLRFALAWCERFGCGFRLTDVTSPSGVISSSVDWGQK